MQKKEPNVLDQNKRKALNDVTENIVVIYWNIFL